MLVGGIYVNVKLGKECWGREGGDAIMCENADIPVVILNSPSCNW